MPNHKLTTDPYELGSSRQRLVSLAADTPADLALGDFGELTTATPDKLRQILDLVPKGGVAMRSFIGGIAAASAREAVTAEPPRVDVAQMYEAVLNQAIEY